MFRWHRILVPAPLLATALFLTLTTGRTLADPANAGAMATAPAASDNCSPSLLFGTPSTFAAGLASANSEPMLADFTGDGIFDCAIVGSQQSGPPLLSIMPGNGNGMFGGARTFPLVNSSGRNAAIGDFNGDGVFDIAYPSYQPRGINIMLGSGVAGVWDWSFLSLRNAPIVGLPATLCPELGRVSSADFNADGLSDLVVEASTTCLDGGLWLFTFKGYGTPGDPTSGGLIESAGRELHHGAADPGRVLIADLNADGAKDLLAFGQINDGGYHPMAYVLLGNQTSGVPDGYFAPQRESELGSRSAVDYGAVLADLGSDGILDLAFPSLIDGTVRVLKGVGGDSVGYFVAEVAYGAGAYPIDIVADDFDGDGAKDVVVSNGSGIALLPGTATESAMTPTLGAPIAFQLSGFSGNPYITRADVNADGRPDILCSTQANNTSASGAYLSVLLNRCADASTERPRIAAIQDVPLDQGGKIKISWYASAHDFAPDGVVDEYWIWRSTPSAAAHAAILAGAAALSTGTSLAPLPGRRHFMRSASADSFWEFVVSQPAGALPNYSYIARTSTDSTVFGNPYTTVFIQARSSDGRYRWDSAPDSGYSVDNLPPRRPRDIGGFYAPPASVTIHWPPNNEDDLSHYVVYAGTSRDFPLEPARRQTETADTVHTANSASRTTFFKVTAIDIHGNESEPITLAPAQVSGIEQLGVPAVTYLAQNHPNPFNPETALEFGMPKAGRVTLRIYTASGRLVRTILDENRPAGAHSAKWDGKDARGIDLPSGVYLAKLSSVGSSKSVKLVLAR